MNKATLGLLLAGLISLPLPVFADDLFVFPSGNCAWTVKMGVYKAADDGSAPSEMPPAPTGANNLAPVQVDVTQVDNYKRIRITTASGKTTEEWTLPNMPVVFKEDPRNGAVFPSRLTSMEMQDERASMFIDATSFSWLNPTYLKEKTAVQCLGKSCFHYVNPATQAEAWIEAKTLLPVALHQDFRFFAFSFPADPPTGPLVPPEKIQKEINYYKLVMGYH